MYTIKESFSAKTEVKRSKFIAHLVPISQFDGLQASLKREHPKANHVVYAFRKINGYDQIVENASDDAEPKGCAGLPTLNVLRGEALVNCAVLIVRYFGGIKLGTGGMARAYALAVKEVIAVSECMAYAKQESYSFSTLYNEVDRVLYRLKGLNLVAYERDFGVEKVLWQVSGDQVNIESLKEIYGVDY